MSNPEQLILKIWNYMKLDHRLEKADAIIAFGSYDPTVGERAAQLFLDGYAPLLVLVGGRSDGTARWEKTEAETFLDTAIKMGVPRDKLLIENKSSNSGENISFTKKLLQENDTKINKAIIVHKPFMERRVYATLRKQWSDLDVIVTSPQVDFKNYKTTLSHKELIGSIVGDLERIKKYPEFGFQINQNIPEDVWEAGRELRKLGYDRAQIDV